MIYFLQSGEGGPIKIGHTEGHVAWRLRQLQHSSPYKLIILGIHAGGHEDEQRLHRRFQESRFRNEWFHPVPDLLEHVESTGGIENFHRLDRTDLRVATAKPIVRQWPVGIRYEFRAVVNGLGRPYTAWREYMALPSEKVCTAIEGFLKARAIEYGTTASEAAA